MEPNLNKKWPPGLPPKYEGKVTTPVILKASSSDPFVREGHLIARELSFRGISFPLPPGESGITSLVIQKGKVVYGATSGDNSHLFKYSGYPPEEVIIYLGKIGENCTIHHSLVAYKNVIFGGTGGKKGGWLFRYYEGEKIKELEGEWAGQDAVQEWEYTRGKIEKIGVPVRGEGVRSLTVDKTRGIIYGISERSGTLFTYKVEEGINQWGWGRIKNPELKGFEFGRGEMEMVLGWSFREGKVSVIFEESREPLPLQILLKNSKGKFVLAYLEIIKEQRS